MTPHKHLALITQWAKDTTQQIEFRSSLSSPWTLVKFPCWKEAFEYRVKPKPKSPGQCFFEASEEASWDNLFPHQQAWYDTYAVDFLKLMKENGHV